MPPPQELADSVSGPSEGKLLLKARPGRRKTPRWSAAGRAPFAKGARAAKRGVEMLRHAALHPLGILPGAKSEGRRPPRR